MAIFNFPIRQDDHARHAVLAARKLQERCRAKRESLAQTHGLEPDTFGVGVGISAGELSFGEFGRSHRDLTAIGTVVNTAARAQAAAEAGQILVTPTVYERARAEMAGSRARDYRLKGFEASIELYAA